MKVNKMYDILGQIKARLQKLGKPHETLDIFKEMDSVIKAEWAVGFHDRGHGHGDFGVITREKTFEERYDEIPEDQMTDELGREILDSTLFPLTIVQCPSQEIAEHIVNLHNESLKK